MASRKKTTEEQLVKAHADAARRAAEAHEQLDQARAAEAKIEAKLVEVEAGDRPELIEQLIRARGAVAAMEAVVGQLDRRAADAEIAVAEHHLAAAQAVARKARAEAHRLGEVARDANAALTAWHNKRGRAAELRAAGADPETVRAAKKELDVARAGAHSDVDAAKGRQAEAGRAVVRALAELNRIRESHGLPAIDPRRAARAPEAVEA